MKLNIVLGAVQELTVKKMTEIENLIDMIDEFIDALRLSTRSVIL